MTTREQQLEAMREEREATLKRLNALFGRLRLDAPPSLTPYTASTADPSAVIFAARELVDESAGLGEETELPDKARALDEQLDAFEVAQAGASDYDEQSSPVVVISMAGLRRIEALFTELEHLAHQLRGGS